MPVGGGGVACGGTGGTGDGVAGVEGFAIGDEGGLVQDRALSIAPAPTTPALPNNIFSINSRLLNVTIRMSHDLIIKFFNIVYTEVVKVVCGSYAIPVNSIQIMDYIILIVAFYRKIVKIMYDSNST